MYTAFRYTEYNLFVNNVPYELDDAGLFLVSKRLMGKMKSFLTKLLQVFGDRYRSCRGAKVYRNSDGSSKGLGFVRFADQTDQQRALVLIFFSTTRVMRCQLFSLVKDSFLALRLEF